MARWLIHLRDGKTLTDAEITPHEVDVLSRMGYSPEDITSVERIIRGKHLTIAKSRFIDTFFVATEEGIDMKMLPGKQKPPEVTKRMLGCYVRDTDPPLQVRLIMDPRTYDTELRFLRVKKKTLRGINAKPVEPKKKGELDKAHLKDVIGIKYAIIESKDIKGFFNTPIGLGCYLKKPRIRAELAIRRRNVLLGFTPPNQKLKLDFA